MFKNKKIVALALLAVMLIVPFASAFAVAPTNDFIHLFQDAVDELPANLVTLAATVNANAVTYSTDPTDANKAAYDNALKAYQDALQEFNAKLPAAEAAKTAAEAIPINDYVGVNFLALSPYLADAAGAVAYGAPANAEGDLATANTDLSNRKKSVGDAKKQIDLANMNIYIGGIIKTIKDKQAAEADAIAKAKVAIDAWVAAYNNAGLSDAERAALKPYMEGAFKEYAKVAGKTKAAAYIAATAKPAQDVLAAVDLTVADVTEVQAKDAKGRTWKVVAPKSNPNALNGAVKLEVRKTEKGVKLALLDKDNKEVASNGLVYVYREVAKGAKIKDVKVGGKTTTFSFDPKTNMIDFALEIAK